MLFHCQEGFIGNGVLDFASVICRGFFGNADSGEEGGEHLVALVDSVCRGEPLFREAYEEAGLTTVELEIADGGHYVESRLVPEGWLREHVVNFDVTLSADAKLNNHPEDVSEFAAKTEEEFLALARAGEVVSESALCMIESLARRQGTRLDDGFYSYRVLRPIKDYSYIV